jgi:hypothetical protein
MHTPAALRQRGGCPHARSVLHLASVNVLGYCVNKCTKVPAALRQRGGCPQDLVRAATASQKRQKRLKIEAAET